MLGFNAPRKLYNIVGITGGSGAGKTALLQYVQRQFCEWSKSLERAQDSLEKLLQQGEEKEGLLDIQKMS
jgi:uridine kinase